MTDNSDAQYTSNDPEFDAYFGSFAYNEVFATTKLDRTTLFLVQLASLIACQSTTGFRYQAGAALDAGVTPDAIKEVTYHGVPYVGMSKAADFIALANEVFTERGISLPLPGHSTTTPENRVAKGREIQEKFFGAEDPDALLPDKWGDKAQMRAHLTANCFGDNYTREGIELKTRELLTFAYLISMGGAEPQLRAHIKGNLAMGNDRATLIDTAIQLLPQIGYPRTLNGLACIDEAASGA